MHLAEAPLSLRADPLDWWRANASRYPILATKAHHGALATPHLTPNMKVMTMQIPLPQTAVDRN